MRMSFSNGHWPTFFAAFVYLAKERPMKITSRFSFLLNSTIDFSLAMWDENVDTMIPLFPWSIVIMVSSTIARAIFSEFVFRSVSAYKQSTIATLTPCFASFLNFS